MNKAPGYVNVDMFPRANPDLVHNLEVCPWPIDSNSASYILFNHSLEHMGKDSETFFNIIKETYRISKPEALIQINVPHPRHNDFINDPTHVRIITPEILDLFSLRKNQEWIAGGFSNSPLAFYTGVNFERISCEFDLDSHYARLYRDGELTSSQIDRLASERNNIIRSTRITLKAIK